ncbi:MAG TPA: hypothetical protein VGH80_13120 [Xanthomonadaceae bacterium]|jgi:hypothetical protein
MPVVAMASPPQRGRPSRRYTAWASLIVLLPLAIPTMLAGCSEFEVNTLGNAGREPAAAMGLGGNGLNEKIAQARGKTVIIFVHGMGDHCPGFALDPANGWFSRERATSLGLVEQQDSFGRLDIEDFDDGDRQSLTVVERRKYTVRATTKQVDAIEIT